MNHLFLIFSSHCLTQGMDRPVESHREQVSGKDSQRIGERVQKRTEGARNPSPGMGVA